MPEFILAKIKVEKAEQCVANTSMDVDTQGMPELYQIKSVMKGHKNMLS